MTQIDSKPYVAIGLLGTTLDNKSRGPKRWNAWRPTLALCQHDDLLISRLELLYQPAYTRLAKTMQEDLAAVSPETTVRLVPIHFDDLGILKKSTAPCTSSRATTTSSRSGKIILSTSPPAATWPRSACTC